MQPKQSSLVQGEKLTPAQPLARSRFRSLFFSTLFLTGVAAISFGAGQVWQVLEQRAESPLEALDQSVAWIRSSLLAEHPELLLLPSTASSQGMGTMKTFSMPPLRAARKGVRAGIVDESGLILNHSIPDLIGTRLPDSGVRKDVLAPLFLRKISAYSKKTRSFDGLEVLASLERLGSSPYALLVEIPSPGMTLQEIRATTENWLSQAAKAMLLVCFGGVFLSLLAFTRKVLARSLSYGTQATQDPRPAVPPPPPARALVHHPVAAEVAGPVSWVLPERGVSAVKATPVGLEPALLAESDLLDHFEWEAAHIRDPKAVASRLVQTASKLCESPVLFFRFDSASGSAVLQAASGFTEGEELASLAFPIETSRLGKILDSSLRGGMESMSDHGPLSTLILARLGVSHFDAWAITGFSHLGRVSRSPRLLGVLVILRAGVESHLRRKSLGRMMRATGLIYENTILSQ